MKRRCQSRAGRLLQAGQRNFYAQELLDAHTQNCKSPSKSETQGSTTGGRSEATSPCRSQGASSATLLRANGYPWEKPPVPVFKTTVLTGDEKCASWVQKKSYLEALVSPIRSAQVSQKRLVAYTPSSSSSISLSSGNIQERKINSAFISKKPLKRLINSDEVNSNCDPNKEVSHKVLCESNCNSPQRKKRASCTNGPKPEITLKDSVKVAIIPGVSMQQPSQSPNHCDAFACSKGSGTRAEALSTTPKGTSIDTHQNTSSRKKLNPKKTSQKSPIDCSIPVKLVSPKDLSNLVNLTGELISKEPLKRLIDFDQVHPNCDPNKEVSHKILCESNCNSPQRKKRASCTNGPKPEITLKDSVKAAIIPGVSMQQPSQSPNHCDAFASSKGSGTRTEALSTPKVRPLYQRGSSSRKVLQRITLGTPDSAQRVDPKASRKSLSFVVKTDSACPSPPSQDTIPSPNSEEDDFSSFQPLKPDLIPLRDNEVRNVRTQRRFLVVSSEGMNSSRTLDSSQVDKSLGVKVSRKSPSFNVNPAPKCSPPRITSSSNLHDTEKSRLPDLSSCKSPTASISQPTKLTYSELRQRNIKIMEEELFKISGRKINPNNISNVDVSDTRTNDSDASWEPSPSASDSESSDGSERILKPKERHLITQKKGVEDLLVTSKNLKTSSPCSTSNVTPRNQMVDDLPLTQDNPETSRESSLHPAPGNVVTADNRNLDNPPLIPESPETSKEPTLHPAPGNVVTADNRNLDNPPLIPENPETSREITFNPQSDNVDENSHVIGDLAEPLSDDDQQNNVAPEKTKSKLKNEMKQLRNLGKEYTSSVGKVVPARERKQHYCVRLKCQERINDEMGDAIFREYWQLGNYDEQVQFIASHVISNPVQRRRKRHEDSDLQKAVSHKYFFEVNGERIPVCKAGFLNLLNISDKFLTSVMLKKKETVSGLTRKDKRGRHPPKHKLSPEVAAAVQNHIDSFPTYISHYCRAQSKSLYFSSSLTYAKMYDLYLTAGNPKVSFSLYRKFVKATGKKFKKPHGDSCSTCDKLKLVISVTPPGPLKQKKEGELELHQRKAQAAYHIKRCMKAEASENEQMRVLVFDLEQVLYCPLLRCKDIFYLRQLSVYNLTIFDTTTKVTSCYMWHEAEGDRGANQIATCIFKHVMKKVPSSVTRIVLFSDCCTSQNRNSHVSAMFHVLLQEHESIQTIEHVFLVPGHTHLEVDNKHSVIERAKARCEKISVPEELYAMVKEAGMTDPINYPDGKFDVVEMKQDFLNFAALLKGPLVLRNNTSNNRKFSWLETHWFRYTKENLGLVEVKNALNSEAPFDILSFLRRGVRKGNIQRLKPLLEKCSSEFLPIPVLKKADLLKLLCFLEEKHHAFYRSLPTSESLQVTDPDLPECSDDEYSSPDEDESDNSNEDD